MSKLRAGEWVEVRSKEEILQSLDKNGQLDGLPFMPQMLQYCGQRFKVYKRAHKTCDTVSGFYKGRRLSNGVHLDLRCDGQAYGGCQAGCLIFWKQAWLKSVDEKMASVPLSTSVKEPSCTEEDVWGGTRAQNPQGGDGRYLCQATQLLRFTKHLPWWDMRQYVEDYSSGNASLLRIFCGFVYVCYYYCTLAYKGRLGIPSRYIYDRFQAFRQGIPFPRRKGMLPADQLAPTSNLHLQPGELVRIKSYNEILKTVSAKDNMNRGLFFDAELVPYCGGIYRVRTRVSRFIDEKTGMMKTLKTPAVILDGVCCQSRYSNYRMFCPRSIYSWWRETWLERVPETSTAKTPRDGIDAVELSHGGPA
jgi:hypothetical protein